MKELGLAEVNAMGLPKTEAEGEALGDAEGNGNALGLADGLTDLMDMPMGIC